MKLFGFELRRIQTLYVTCSRGDHSARILFAPSEKGNPIPFSPRIKDLLKELGIDLELPKCDDLHFLCMKCMVSMKHCEKFNKECKINEKEVYSQLAKELKSIEP